MEQQKDMEWDNREKKRPFYGVPAKILITAGICVCICLVIFCGGLLTLLLNSGMSFEDMGDSRKYVDTANCAHSVTQNLHVLSADLAQNRKLETDGTATSETQVDITRLLSGRERGSAVTEINTNLSYTLEGLQRIYEEGTADRLSDYVQNYEYDNYDGHSGEQGYYYSRMSADYLADPAAEYTKEDMEAAVKKGLGQGSMAGQEDKKSEASDETGETQGELFLTGEELQLAGKIQEISGRSITEFSDKFIYLFDKGLSEEHVQTVAGGTLAEYAAANYSTVSLEDLYISLPEASYYAWSYVPTSSIISSYNGSNIKFYIKDSGGVVYTNVPEWSGDKEALGKTLDTCELSVWYDRRDGVASFESVTEDTPAGQVLRQVYESDELLDKNETVYVGLDTSFPEHDSLYLAAKTYDSYVPWTKFIVLLGIGAAGVLVLLLIVSTVQSGRNPYDRTVKLYGFDRLPTEVSFAVGLIVCSLAIALGVYTFAVAVNGAVTVWIFLIVAVVVMLCLEVCLMFYYSLVRRIKGKNLWKNSLTHSIVSVCRNVYAARDTSAKIMILFGGFVFLHFMLISGWSGFGVFLCLILDTIVLLYLIREVAGRRTVIEGLQQIGSGDLDYKVDTTNLIGDNLHLAETVNRVGEGLQAAVKERMKSERLKADLITNVSHDIKTPLTSIINYVDLLKRERIDDPKIKGYIDILDAKSQRLKQLTEDLVEASKVSSGNIKLEFITLNLNELVQQMNGEFDERFENRGLDLICTLEKEALRISADGRRIWRVLENLYGNVAKYGMPGTRVYVQTYKKDGKVIFTMKNISENPLNINAEELTERFIRGDVSRSTEGSGLGLSIAQNLTKLQRGTFQIYLDGDLFKVTVTFDEVPAPVQAEKQEIESVDLENVGVEGEREKPDINIRMK